MALNQKKRESKNKIRPGFSTVLRVKTKRFIKFIGLKYLQIRRCFCKCLKRKAYIRRLVRKDVRC